MSSGVARAPKRARDDAASAASGGSGEADARPAKLPARANDEGQQEQADAGQGKEEEGRKRNAHITQLVRIGVEH